MWIWLGAEPTSTHEILLSELPLQFTLDPNRLLLCQYQSDTAMLVLAPGSPIPLAIGGAIGIAVIVIAVVVYHQRRRS